MSAKNLIHSGTRSTVGANVLLFGIIFLIGFASLMPLRAQESQIDDAVRFGGGPSIIQLQALSIPDKGYRPLWDDDALSSQWILSVNGEQISPVEDNWLRDSSERAGIVTLEHKSRGLTLHQEMKVLVGERHVLLTATIHNNSAESIRVSLNLLLDTELGEANGLPFLLDNGEYISSERFFRGPAVPKWVKTEQDVYSPTLTLILSGRGISQPEYLIMANWRRLKEAGLNFKPVEGRDFDMLPFSRRDSAILMGFRERTVPAAGNLSVSFVMGLDENLPSTDSAVRQSVPAAGKEIETQRFRIYTIRERLAEIESQLNRINRLLEHGEELEPDRFLEAETEIEAAVDTLEQRRMEYENL